MHLRTRPVEHRFEMPLYTWLIDLDELPALDRRLHLFAVNRRAPFALHDRDHDGATGVGLRAAAIAFLTSHGVPVGDGRGWRFELLALVRTFGYVFNPVTFTFCTAPGGALAGVVAEVRNTFGKVHRYWLGPGQAIAAARGASYRDDKLLHVSPFFDLDLSWLFHFRAVDERLDVAMDVIHDFEPSAPSERQGPPLMVARMWGRRRPLTDAILARLALTYPFMTARVMAGIHFEALKLWWKGAPFHSEPAFDPEATRSRHARTHASPHLATGPAQDGALGPPPGARGAGAAT
jgi:hypothetical protein